MNLQYRLKLIACSLLVIIVFIAPTASLLNAADSNRPMQSHDFVDVPVAGKDFMAPYIDAFYHMGITGGCSTSPLMYCPEDPVTRGSLAVFMGRALGYVDAQTAGYNTRAYFKHPSISGFDDAFGVVGESKNNVGVYGLDTGDGIGVWARSAAGRGLFAESHSGTAITARSTFGTGIYAITYGVNQRAIYAESNQGDAILAISSDGYGVWAGSQNSHGVWGTSGNGYGVLGESVNNPAVGAQSQNNLGVFATSQTYSALLAQSNLGSADSSTDGLFDVELGGAIGEIYGNVLHFFTSGSFIIDLNEGGGSNEVFMIRNDANNPVFTVDEAGNMAAMGSKSAIVSTMHYGDRKMYAVESPENWFEDFGSAELVDGEAVIRIDRMFAETVNLSEEYHVYLTPIGDPVLLYIEEQTATSFTVRSADGSDVEFSYRIVGKRLGYEDVRMEEFED